MSSQLTLNFFWWQVLWWNFVHTQLFNPYNSLVGEDMRLRNGPPGPQPRSCEVVAAMRTCSLGKGQCASLRRSQEPRSEHDCTMDTSFRLCGLSLLHIWDMRHRSKGLSNFKFSWPCEDLGTRVHFLEKWVVREEGRETETWGRLNICHDF